MPKNILVIESNITTTNIYLLAQVGAEEEKLLARLAGGFLPEVMHEEDGLLAVEYFYESFHGYTPSGKKVKPKYEPEEMEDGQPFVPETGIDLIICVSDE